MEDKISFLKFIRFLTLIETKWTDTKHSSSYEYNIIIILSKVQMMWLQCGTISCTEVTLPNSTKRLHYLINVHVLLALNYQIGSPETIVWLVTKKLEKILNTTFKFSYIVSESTSKYFLQFHSMVWYKSSWKYIYIKAVISRNEKLFILCEVFTSKLKSNSSFSSYFSGVSVVLEEFLDLFWIIVLSEIYIQFICQASSSPLLLLRDTKPVYGNMTFLNILLLIKPTN